MTFAVFADCGGGQRKYIMSRRKNACKQMNFPFLIRFVASRKQLILHEIKINIIFMLFVVRLWRNEM